jgi:hypothetical protein
MAKAAAENIEEIWTIKRAYHYLVKEVGLPSHTALRQMAEKIQKAKLPVLVNGHVAPRPDWMDVALGGDGEAQILSIGPGLGWDPEAYVFTVAADDVRRLWKLKATRTGAHRKTQTPCDRVIELFNGPLKGKIWLTMSVAEAMKLVKAYCAAQRREIGRAGKPVSEETVGRALTVWEKSYSE